MSSQDLLAAFKLFSRSADNITNVMFVKLCKDSELIDENFPTTQADLIFLKHTAKKNRRLDFNGFLQALQDIATYKQCSLDTIHEKILNTSGPQLKGTVPLPTRFHDDKNTYTGVHAHGGPTLVDKGHTMIADLSDIANRTPCDIRGVSTATQEK